MAQGSAWEFGVAIPIKNRKFEFGQIKEYSITTDPLSESGISQNETEFGISASTQDQDSWPSFYIQYGDRGTIGPSSNATWEGYSEAFRIGAAAETYGGSTTAWTDGVIYPLDRRMKYIYQNGDVFTVYGTGCADSWEPINSHCMPMGIRKGYSALGGIGKARPYDVSMYTTPVEQSVTGDNAFIMFSTLLPVHENYNTNITEDTTSSLYYSSRGLAPWRDADETYMVNGFDYEGYNQGELTDFKGVFRYIKEYNDSDKVTIGYNININASFIDVGIDTIKAPILTGFPHSGGQYSDYSQAIVSVINDDWSTFASNTYTNTGLLRQLLVTSEEDYRDVQYTVLTSRTQYRLGLTWKGEILPATADSDGSKFYVRFRWTPLTGSYDIDHDATGFITTGNLLGDGTKAQSAWTTSTASDYVPYIDMDDLETTKSLAIEVYTIAESPDTFAAAARNGRGAEVRVYIDNIWLEHQGDITSANAGYVTIDHYPEQDTLQVGTFNAGDVKRVKLSNGSIKEVDTTGLRFKELYTIESDFVNVSQTVWQQFQDLLRWQNMGHKLTLHPSLDEVPECLVGNIEITNVQKPFWDLSKWTFHLRFTEND